MRSSVLRSLCAAALLWALALSAACVDFDVPGEIKDLRILAVQLEPPEVMYSPFMTLPAAQRPPPMFRPPPPFPPAEVEVSARVLAADPRSDEPVVFTSRFCPASSNDECRNFALPADTELETTERDLPELHAALDPLLEPQARWVPTTDAFGTRQGEFSRLLFNERAIEYTLPHDPSGAAFILFQAFTRVVLWAENEGVREVAFRRLPLNPYLDLSSFPPEAQEQFEEFLGVEVCTPAQAAEEDATCLKPRQANRNPVVEEMRYSLDGDVPEYDEDGRDTRAKGSVVSGPIAMAPGDTLTIWPVFPDEVYEPYQIFEVALEDFSFYLANYKEDMAVSWYTTSGFTAVDVSELALNLGYHTVYTYPTLDPPERVQIYMVVRDQRGGVAWQTIELVQE